MTFTEALEELQLDKSLVFVSKIDGDVLQLWADSYGFYVFYKDIAEEAINSWLFLEIDWIKDESNEKTPDR